jgi:hypothetical protein
LFIGKSAFFLESPVTLFGISTVASLRLPFRKITAIQDSGDFIQIAIGIIIRLGTDAGPLIIRAWKNHKSQPKESIDVHFGVPDRRVHAIALALYLLTERVSFSGNTALALLEAALAQSPVVKATTDVALAGHAYADLRVFVREIVDAGLFEPVAVLLSSYLLPDDAMPLWRLAPIFLQFINSSSDHCKLATVMDNLFSLSVNFETLTVLLRSIWGGVTSELAVRLLVPNVLASSLPIAIVQRTLHMLSARHESLLGSLVVNNYLDGTIRRRVFGYSLNPERLFAGIRTLPFDSPILIGRDFSRLVFCSIVGGIHQKQEHADNARLFLDSSLRTLEDFRIDLDFAEQRAKLAVLMENTRVMNALSVISVGREITMAVDPAEESAFLKFATEFAPGDNPHNWCVKAALVVSLGARDLQLANRFLQSLSSFVTSNYGPQKFALALQSLAALVPIFPPTSPAPPCLFWPALFAAGHSNQNVRLASLALLANLIPWALDLGGYPSVSALGAAKSFSPVIASVVASFEEAMGVNFATNFAGSFAICLTRALIEIETRAPALHLLEICIRRLSKDSSDAVHFALPFIAFDQNEPQWLFSGSKIPEFVLRDFEERTPDNARAIVAYLAEMFGDRHCSHNIERLADCLALGCTRFPTSFAPLKKQIVSKSWKMIDVETNEAKIAKIAMVAGCFYKVKAVKGSGGQGRAVVNRLDDGMLVSFIAGVADAIQVYGFE